MQVLRLSKSSLMSPRSARPNSPRHDGQAGWGHRSLRPEAHRLCATRATLGAFSSSFASGRSISRPRRGREGMAFKTQHSLLFCAMFCLWVASGGSTRVTCSTCNGTRRIFKSSGCHTAHGSWIRPSACTGFVRTCSQGCGWARGGKRTR